MKGQRARMNLECDKIAMPIRDSFDLCNLGKLFVLYTYIALIIDDLFYLITCIII